MEQKEENELREILRENFPEKAEAELNVMLQILLDAGGVEGYVEKVNGIITKVGVVLKDGSKKTYSTGNIPPKTRQM